jgi:3-oxoacyl-[acyl-carrier-protein] synthase-3
MRCDGLFVAGIAHWLPAMVPVAEAVAAGAYDAQEQARNDYASVTVAEADDAPPVMAVRAARAALDRSSVAPGDISLLLHASFWFQGIDFWSAAPYIHNAVLPGNRHAPAIDISQMSNGSLGGVELAASYLAADPARRAALVTVADRFQLPGFDRWRSDVAGIVYGDGGAAIVLSRDGGFARLLAIVTVVDTRLESMYRGSQPFGARSGEAGWPLDNRARRRAHLDGTGFETVVERTTAGLTGAVERALLESGVKRTDIARFVFPSVGLAGLSSRYLEPLGLDLPVTTWDWGRRTGHVGAADQIIGLAQLVDSGTLEPGQHAMLVGIGAGFSWSGAVVEIDRRPGWPVVATAVGGWAEPLP